MANFDRAFIDQVLSSTDIVDVIKEKVNLTKNGATLKVCVHFTTKKHLHSMSLRQNNFIIALVVVLTVML